MRRIKSIILFTLILGSCGCSTESGAEPARRSIILARHPVGIDAIPLGRDFAKLIVRNHGRTALCINPLIFDTHLGHIVIMDADGKTEGPRNYADPTHDPFSGFDYKDPYTIVPPNRESYFDLDLSIFNLSAGSYTIEADLVAYNCTQALSGTVTPRPIREHFLRWIILPPRKILP